MRVILDKDVTEANVDSAAWDLQWSLGDFTKAEGTTPKQVFYYKRTAYARIESLGSTARNTETGEDYPEQDESVD